MRLSLDVVPGLRRLSPVAFKCPFWRPLLFALQSCARKGTFITYERDRNAFRAPEQCLEIRTRKFPWLGDPWEPRE